MSSSSPHGSLHVETQVVALGRPDAVPGAAVNVPVSFTSTYAAGGAGYARFANPSWEPLEEAIGALEGGDALIHASGMGAIAAVFALLPHDGTLLVPEVTYNGTSDLGLAFEAAGGTVLRRAADDTAGFIADLARADVALLESPTNPLMETLDLAAILGAATDLPVVTAVDNTLSTPLLCQPISLGADIVVHSVTKYLAGHSDVLLGATVTRPDDHGRAIGQRLLRHRTLHGAIAGPMEAYLALRGLRTLALRVERASASAAVLAQRLTQHPAVSRVRYPGQGAMLSIEVGAAEEPQTAETVCSATRLWLNSTSLGGVESQLERRRRHPSEPTAVPPNLIRLSVGIEHVEDLWADLDQALRTAIG